MRPGAAGGRALAHYRRYPVAWCKAKGHQTGPMVRGTGRRWKRCRRCGRMVLRMGVGALAALMKRTYGPEYFKPMTRMETAFFMAGLVD